MKTVSTLCATSTIGVAACGLAFGQPAELTSSASHIQLPQSDICSSHRASPVSFPSSATGSRSGGQSPTNMTTSSQETTTPASSSTAGTKRKWYRRLSEAAMKSRGPTTPQEGSSTTSFSDLARRLSVGFGGRSRSNTLKSLGRSNSQKVIVTSSAPEHIDRPATYGPSFMRYGPQSLYSPSGSSLPFSFQSSIHSTTYQPEHINDWEFYLQPKRVKFTTRSGNMSPPRSPAMDWIKRIFPSTKGWKPTLVKPTDISYRSQEIPDVDYEDHRDIEAVYDGSRSTSPAVSSGSRPRRSLSVSGFLSSSMKFGPGPTARKRRRLSIIPSAHYEPPTTSDGHPTVNTVTDTNIHQPFPNTTVRLIPNEISHEHSPTSPLTPIAPQQQTDLPAAMDIDQPQTYQDQESSHARRPSLLVSERASTLIGSDDIEQDFLSDTVFDSLRTRASPTHPPKLDTLFNGNEQPPSRGHPTLSLESSPINLDEPMQRFPLNQSAWSMGEEPFAGLSPSNTRPQTRSHPVSPFTDVFNKSDYDGRDQDESESVLRGLGDDIANAFKRNSKERPHNSTFPRRRPHARNSSNLDTFDIGRKSMEAPSIDGERIISGSDWSESFTKSGRNSREITATANSKSRQRAPSTHTRSRSMPVAGVFADSNENWDDDFDDDFGGDVVIPKSIKDAQATVIGHLGNVREFAKQVETLKKLVEKANHYGVRNEATSKLWDEAEGIITLATVDDDVPISAMAAEPGTPLFDTFDIGSNTSQENIHLPRPLRRSSVLLPDDDIFGSEFFQSRNTTPRLPQEPFISSKSSSPALIKDEKKAVNNAKSIVARVQKREISERPSKERLVPSPLQPSKAPTPENRLKFDTTSLQELVAHVKDLIKQLEATLPACEVPKQVAFQQPLTSQQDLKQADEEFLLQEELSNYQDILPAFIQEDTNKVSGVPIDALMDLSLSEKPTPPVATATVTNTTTANTNSTTPTNPASPTMDDAKGSAAEPVQKGRMRSGTASRRRRSSLMTFV